MQSLAAWGQGAWSKEQGELAALNCMLQLVEPVISPRPRSKSTEMDADRSVGFHDVGAARGPAGQDARLDASLLLVNARHVASDAVDVGRAD